MPASHGELVASALVESIASRIVFPAPQFKDNATRGTDKEIPKADGKQRPLGIPTIEDRVAQTAALLVLEPIFETDLRPDSF